METEDLINKEDIIKKGTVKEDIVKEDSVKEDIKPDTLQLIQKEPAIQFRLEGWPAAVAVMVTSICSTVCFFAWTNYLGHKK